MVMWSMKPGILVGLSSRISFLCSEKFCRRACDQWTQAWGSCDTGFRLTTTIALILFTIVRRTASAPVSWVGDANH